MKQNCRLFSTIMVDTFGFQYMWYNSDLLGKLTGMINLTQTRAPNHNVVFYINMDTSEEQIEEFKKRFEAYIRRELNSIVSDKIFLVVCNLDLFMKSEVMIFVRSFVPFSNGAVRWGTHDKLFRAVRVICKELGIKSDFNIDSIKAGAIGGMQALVKGK